MTTGKVDGKFRCKVWRLCGLPQLVIDSDMSVPSIIPNHLSPESRSLGCTSRGESLSSPCFRFPYFQLWLSRRSLWSSMRDDEGEGSVQINDCSLQISHLASGSEVEGSRVGQVVPLVFCLFLARLVKMTIA